MTSKKIDTKEDNPVRELLTEVFRTVAEQWIEDNAQAIINEHLTVLCSKANQQHLEEPKTKKRKVVDK